MANLLLNPGFETVSAGPDWSNWTEETSPGGSLVDETSHKNEGDHSLKVICNGAGQNAWVYQDVSVDDNFYYTLTFWTAGDNTNEGRYRVRDVTTGQEADILAETGTGVPTSTWEKVTYTFKTPNNCDTVRIFFVSQPGTTNAYAHFDTTSLEKGITKTIKSTARFWDTFSKNISATSRLITSNYKSTVSGRAKLWLTPTKSIHSTANLVTHLVNERNGYSEVYDTYTKTVNSTAQFYMVFDDDRDGYAEVYDTYTKTIKSTALLYGVLTKTVNSTARLFLADSKNRRGRARTIRTTTKTVNSTAQFIESLYDNTVNSTARLILVDSKNRRGRARTVITITKTINSTAQFVESLYDNTVNSTARLFLADSKNRRGRSRLVKVYTKTINSRTSFKKTPTKTINSTAKLLIVGIKEIQSTARLYKTIPNVRDGYAEIYQPYTKTTTSTARLWHVASDDRDGYIEIYDTSTKTINSTTRFWIIPVKDINATARFEKATVASVKGRAKLVLQPIKAIHSTAYLKASNLLKNGNFEGLGGVDVFTYWIEVFTQPQSEVIADFTDVHTDDYSCKLRNGGLQPSLYQDVTVVGDTYYDLTLYSKGDAAEYAYYEVYDNDNAAILISGSLTKSTSWTHFQLGFQTPDNCTSIRVTFKGPDSAGISWIDRANLIDKNDNINSTVRFVTTTSKVINSTAQLVRVAFEDTRNSTARLVITSIKNIKGSARLVTISIKNIKGRARLVSTFTKNINATAKLHKVTIKGINSTTRLFNVYDDTINGRARLVTATTKNIKGRAKLVKSPIKSINSTVRFYDTRSDDRDGYTEIYDTVTKTITSTAQLERHLSKTINATAKLSYIPIKTVNSTARLFQTVTDERDGYIEVYDTSTKSIHSTFLLSKTGIDKSINSTTRLFAILEPKIVRGESRLVTVTTKTIPSTTKLKVGNMLENSDFEGLGGGGADVFTHWVEVFSTPQSEVIADGVVKYAGNYACKLDNGGSQPSIYQDNITVTVNTYYDLAFYSRGDGAEAGYYEIYDETNAAVLTSGTANKTTSWTRTVIGFKTPSNCVSIKVTLKGPDSAGSCWFDNGNLIDVRPSIKSTARLWKFAAKTINATAKLVLGDALVPNTINGRARLISVITKTIKSTSRLVIVVTKTINGRARLVTITSKNIKGRSRLVKTYTKTINSTAQFYQPDVQKTLKGTARLFKLYSKNINATAKLWYVTTKEVKGRARLVLTVIKSIHSTAKLWVVPTKYVHGTTRLVNTYIKNVKGTAKLWFITTISIKGRARLVTTTIKSVSGESRLVKTYIKSIKSEALFLKLNTEKTINSTVRFYIDDDSEQPGYGEVYDTYSDTINGRARLVKSPIKSIHSTAKLIEFVGVLGKNNWATARLVAGDTFGVTKTINSTARLFGGTTITKDINSTAKFVEYNQEKTITSTVRLTSKATTQADQFMTFYALDTQASWTTGTPVISGVEQDKPCIPVKNMPYFDPGMEIIHNRKQNELATFHTDEFRQGVKSPNSTWEFDANVYNLANILWSLFQNGSGEESDTYLKVYKAYTSSSIETSLTLTRKVYDLSFSTQKYQRIIGAVCNRLTLTHESGTLLNASADFVGYNYEGDYNPLGDVIGFSDKDPLKFGYKFYLDNRELRVQSWSIEITNNATSKYGQSQNPDEIRLGDMNITGNFVIPWGTGHHIETAVKQIQDFINGVDKQFDIYWGTRNADNAGDMAFRLNIRFQNVEVINDDEVALSISFIAVKDSDNEPIEIFLNDGIRRGITDRHAPTFEQTKNATARLFKISSKTVSAKAALHHWKEMHSTVMLYKNIPNERQGYMEILWEDRATITVKSTAKFWGEQLSERGGYAEITT